ncbi:MAG: bifunctional phosphopantothenoylcysteine decarboxylase/phosphopantothenate--cysteine ligase CoaBC [Bacteroidetes bacterium]|nr:MAG: bifunctional phosphopantothenoylcysteine decarboxylase/phosphopantothenate--cysteine ligase CoaBC [Bacteroidota bacterium]REJ99882.1 MAG: bifunctional phosphopantothenoylcysteine decarboxylase/phosphopantothenate--cysteine ligase CoaBC [Bacteroidota bacterium]REK34255.1 MAG: bifunctional phosphopantothenoylcysteine decarboxylase/phosphopantothenate--cysteine ligase CoaBC [Bacteroidota bacterium]REK50585.1 MAG: bifunctional phosphopantothenoylcysteine decarboxylase/phosphopantothenate--cy
MKGKRILLGVTGSIAAYKSAVLVRLLVKAGAEVKIIMTRDACEFITPLTMSVLSGNQVYTESFNRETGKWNSHIELGMWADLFLITPATANTIAKMASGICDNLLLETYLSARCPVMLAPAMDLDMWKHQTTVKNIRLLTEAGVKILSPDSGELASGLSGEGRLREPEDIFNSVNDFFFSHFSLNNLDVLITAGPTYEAIDPVRFIGNRSTGTMGYRIAEVLAARGARVTLVSGPSEAKLQNDRIKKIEVESADEMYDQCMQHAGPARLIIMSAAVSDYKPQDVSSVKIKKENSEKEISLIPTKDILAELGKNKSAEQVLVGFALETNNEIENAKLKLKNKNLDFIVLNSLKDQGAGFGTQTNKISIIGKDGKVTDYTVKMKGEVAVDIVDFLMPSLKK